MRHAIRTVLLALAFGACSPGPPTHHQRLELDGDAIRIPSSSVDDGAVHFFTFAHDGKDIDFLVRSDGAGALHAHLDACYACYRYKRGFVVEGTHLVCVACRLEYAIEDEVWDYIGACAPISIHASQEGGELVIEGSVLERASRYF